MARMTGCSKITIACLLLVNAIAASGCSSGNPKVNAEKSVSTTAPPKAVYRSEALKGSLLALPEITRNLKSQELGFEGLSRNSIPTCPDSLVTLSNHSVIELGQYADNSDPYSPRYARIVALYEDEKSAAGEFQKLRESINRCPASGNVQSKKVSKTKITLPYTFKWSARQADYRGFSAIHVTHSRHANAAGRSDTIALALDYATRANVVLATIYWERLRPDEKSDAIEQSARKIIQKQLNKIPQ